MFSEWALKFGTILFGGGIVAICGLIVQSRYYHKTSLFNSFKDIAKLLEEVHVDRNKIYAKPTNSFRERPWSTSEQNHDINALPWPWRDVTLDELNKVCRAFDNFGLMVRLGAVPIEIVAGYYSYPILKTWQVAGGFIRAQRRTRNQKGHRWEFENLVFNVVIPGVRSNKGPWKGVMAHDGLKSIVDDIEDDMRVHTVRNRDRDEDYGPQASWWKLLPRWERLILRRDYPPHSRVCTLTQSTSKPDV